MGANIAHVGLHSVNCSRIVFVRIWHTDNVLHTPRVHSALLVHVMQSAELYICTA